MIKDRGLEEKHWKYLSSVDITAHFFEALSRNFTSRMFRHWIPNIAIVSLSIEAEDLTFQIASVNMPLTKTHMVSLASCKTYKIVLKDHARRVWGLLDPTMDKGSFQVYG